MVTIITRYISVLGWYLVWQVRITRFDSISIRKTQWVSHLIFEIWNLNRYWIILTLKYLWEPEWSTSLVLLPISSKVKNWYLYALDGISLGFNLNPKPIDTLFCLAYLMCHLCIKFISQKIWEIEFENIKKSSSILSFAICLYYEKFGFASFEGWADRVLAGIGLPQHALE